MWDETDMMLQLRYSLKVTSYPRAEYISNGSPLGILALPWPSAIKPPRFFTLSVPCDLALGLSGPITISASVFHSPTILLSHSCSLRGLVPIISSVISGCFVCVLIGSPLLATAYRGRRDKLFTGECNL